MKFNQYKFVDIKNKIWNISSYQKLLETEYVWDVFECIHDEIDVYCSDMWNIKRYVIVYSGQQIWDCKVIVDDKQKKYYVSSIAIVPNLQGKWIGSSFYNKVIIPRMQLLYPEYVFVPGPWQTDLWEILWTSTKLDLPYLQKNLIDNQ